VHDGCFETSLVWPVSEGRDVALVSDGGTPGVADPGALLVREAARRGVAVVPVPGPSAPAALLSVSGIPADRYVFEGFLPHRAGERRRRLRAFRAEPRPVVLFESPKRIRETLRDIAEVLGDRQLILGRELTKLHETVLRGTADAVLEQLADTPRGEVTLILADSDTGTAAPRAVDDQATRVRAAWTAALSAEAGDRRRALRRTARELGLGRDELQRLLDEIGESRPAAERPAGDDEG
jgi:16S rRNA (cytidine1402-2'-O)-methyltransferase